MERKEFIKTCGFACLGSALLSGSFFASCSSIKMVNGQIVDSKMEVPMSSFLNKDNTYKKYIVVQNEKLEFPICVYRNSNNEYIALLMKCTHQGAELQVFGDRLQCPAHGSEFNNTGIVQNGPADKNLRAFLVNIQNEIIKINLK